MKDFTKSVLGLFVPKQRGIVMPEGVKKPDPPKADEKFTVGDCPDCRAGTAAYRARDEKRQNRHPKIGEGHKRRWSSANVSSKRHFTCARCFSIINKFMREAA